MQTHLLLGPTPAPAPLNPRRPYGRSLCQRIRRRTTVVSASSYAGGENHYAVLGIARNATQLDIKRAYRLLARKFHPDVNKDSRATELFKTIRSSYQVLSNEATRTQYDRALKHEDTTPEVEHYYSWSEKRRQSRYQRFYSTYPDSHFYTETHQEEGSTAQEPRDSFVQVLKSAFLSMFLLHTLGCLASLTFSTLTALADKELDMGYKVGFMVAWILGGKGGILVTLCLTFASWVCGKASSSVVVVVVVATWVGSNLARHAPLPQGALLTLLYMSIKLQADSTGMF